MNYEMNCITMAKLLSEIVYCWGGLSTGGTIHGGHYAWSARECTIQGEGGCYPVTRSILLLIGAKHEAAE